MGLINKIWDTFWNRWAWQLKLVAVGIGLLLILVLFFFASMDSCRSRNTEKKIDRIETNIKTAEITANILTNQKENINQQVKENENNKNIAANNFNNSIRRDSNTFTGSPEDKFCRKFCNDSTCFEWRKTHECGL